MAQNNLNLCPECGNTNLISDSTRGELICNVCGLVLSQKIIDSGPEWRAFSSEEANKKVRVGAPTTLTLHDKGLSTIIGWKDKDAFGKSISPKMKAEVYRLRKWQERTKTTKAVDRNLNTAMIELDRIASQLNISKDLTESAAYIYRKTLKKKLSKGRSIKGIMTASIFIACRMNYIPITLESIDKITLLKKRIIAKNIRLIQYELNIKLPISSPKDFISYFCSKLELSGDVQSLTVRLLDLFESKGLMNGKSPQGIASGALYLACRLQNESRSQKEISKIAKITEATLRNRYKEFLYLIKTEENLLKVLE